MRPTREGGVILEGLGEVTLAQVTALTAMVTARQTRGRVDARRKISALHGGLRIIAESHEVAETTSLTVELDGDETAALRTACGIANQNMVFLDGVVAGFQEVHGITDRGVAIKELSEGQSSALFHAAGQLATDVFMPMPTVLLGLLDIYAPVTQNFPL
jgi:hypothetical protein